MEGWCQSGRIIWTRFFYLSFETGRNSVVSTVAGVRRRRAVREGKRDQRERRRTRKKTTAMTRIAVISPTHRPALKMPPTAAQPAAPTVAISNSVRVWSRTSTAVGEELLCTACGLHGRYERQSGLRRMRLMSPATAAMFITTNAYETRAARSRTLAMWPPIP